MNNNAIARKMAEFGKREAVALGLLQRVHDERCAFLQSLIPQAGLDSEVTTLATEPKDP